MTTQRAIEVLNAYQAWRHFGGGKDASFLNRPVWGPEIPNPDEVDQAFQEALEALKERQQGVPIF